MNLRPRLFSNRPPPRWALALLAGVAVALLLLGGALSPADAGTYSSTLYLSGASSSVVTGAYQLVTAAGPGTPSTAPTSSLNCSSCGGNLANGSYTYRYTDVDASGGETAPSAASSPTTTVSGGGAAKINIGGLPTGVHVRLYRTTGGIGPWNLVADLPNNSSSTYIDNIAAASLGGLLPQAQNRTIVSSTGYYEYAPGNALTTSAASGDFAKVASPSFDGKGWVVDGSGAVSFAAGTWTTTVKITSAAGNGTARLDVGMWIVDNSGAVVGSPLIDPTCTTAPCASGGVPGEYATANIATVSGTASAIAPSFSLPALSLASTQHLYVQFWRHQTAGSTGSTYSTLAAYDGTAQITHPTANAFPNAPTLGSIAARVNTVPQLSATFSDPDGSDTGTLSFQICSDAACNTVLPSGSGSTAPGIANGANGTWTPPVTLVDGTTYYWRAQATDSAGNVSGWSSTSSFVYDTTPPTVSGVTASNGNGAYKAGQTIHVQVDLSEAVNVTGSPKLALNPSPAESATYASGSGTSTLTFDYTVQAGDNVAALDYTGVGALTLNGGTIADLATNNATLTLASPGAAGSLAANKSIAIDTVAPTAGSVTAANGNGAYKAGQTIQVQVSFSEPVTATGSPQLALNTTPAESAAYTSGSGTSTLTFDYTVQAGDNVGTLDYTGTGALTLNGGTIADLATNNATLTLASSGAAGSLAANKSIRIDTNPPGIPSLEGPADASYLPATPALSATFSNSDAGDSGTLDFEVCSDSGCTSVVQSGSSAGGLLNGASGSWTPSGLADGGYYWHARAQDAAGNLSGWSATQSFTLDTTDPAVPPLGSVAARAQTTPLLSATFSDPPASDSGTLAFQLCANSGCTTVLQTDTASGVAESATADWTPSSLADGDYYWRVRATDAAGNMSAWSAASSFVVDTTPPGLPAFVSPAAAARVNSTLLQATFVDSDPTDSGTVTFQLCSDAGCSSVVGSSTSATVAGGTGVSWTPGGLADGTYYWRLSGLDIAGNQGAWTSTHSFVLDTDPPGVPALTSPAAGAHINNASPVLGGTFTSSDSGDSGSLSYQVCTDSGCASVVQSGSSYSGLTSGTTGTWAAASLADGVYYWRAQAQDAAGNLSGWSATESFTLNTTPPSGPSVSSPADGLLIDRMPTLAASYTNPTATGDSGSLVFDVCSTTACAVVLRSGAIGGLHQNDTATWTPTGLTDGTYYWSVRAEDSAGNLSGWTSVRRFTIDSTPPPAPVLERLAGAHVNPSLQLGATVLEPADPRDSARLLIELCTDPACTSVVTTGYTGFGSVGTPMGWQAPRLADGPYYWRALAEDAAGNQSPWAPVDSFVVDSVVPSAPEPGGPASGAMVNAARLTGALPNSITTGGGGIEFEICADPGCAKTVRDAYVTVPVSGAAPVWTPTGLPDGSYYWRIRVDDAAGNESGWSIVKSFTLIRTPPGRPRDLKARVKGRMLTLRWQAPARAAHLVGYTLLVNGRPTRLLAAKVHVLRIKLRPIETRWFSLDAVDAAGNIGAPTKPVRVDPRLKP